VVRGSRGAESGFFCRVARCRSTAVLRRVTSLSARGRAGCTTGFGAGSGGCRAAGGAVAGF
jgi:hypothetical protein